MSSSGELITMGPERLESYIPVKVLAEPFYEIISDKACEIPKISPLLVEEGVLLDGEWGKTGSITLWRYFLDGKLNSSKDRIEAVDRKCNAITYKVFEGDILEYYKSFKLTVQATTDKEKGGSVVRCILEYEKRRRDVPDPYMLMYLFVMLSKDIEYYLLKC